MALAFPIYAGGSEAAAVRYVGRLGNLQGIHPIIIDVPPNERALRQKVQAENGIVMPRCQALKLAHQKVNATTECI